jgi:enoyl-CoA hydratase/carnithine racemase
VVPRDQTLSTAIELAGRIAEKSRFSVSRLKRLVNSDLGLSLWRAVDLEETATIQAFQQSEAAERVKKFAMRKAS